MIATDTTYAARLLPEPGARGRCPECGSSVLAKCGHITIWHWAHKPGEGHDCKSAGESEWHLKWKWWALKHGCRVEVPFQNGTSRSFRADIVTPKGHVVELQSKPPAYDTVLRREQVYTWRLRWLFRITAQQQERIKWGKQLNNGGQGFRFKRPPKLLSVCQRPTYFDFEMDGEIMQVSLTLKPSFYDPERTVMLGVARESDWRSLFDVQPGEQMDMLSTLSGQDGTTAISGTG